MQWGKCFPRMICQGHGGRNSALTHATRAAVQFERLHHNQLQVQNIDALVDSDTILNSFHM
jgi:hypothetical protein